MLDYYNKLSSEVYDIDKYIGYRFGEMEFYNERLASGTNHILEPGITLQFIFRKRLVIRCLRCVSKYVRKIPKLV